MSDGEAGLFDPARPDRQDDLDDDVAAPPGRAVPEAVTGEGASTLEGDTAEATGDVRVYPETATVRAEANPVTVTKEVTLGQAVDSDDDDPGVDPDDVPEIGVPHDEDFSRALDPALRIEAIRATAGHVSSSVEVLVSVTVRELRVDNSRLRQELEAAHVQIEFLEHALDLLREAQATGRSSFLSRTLTVVGVVFTAVVGGASSGVAQGLVTGSPNVTVQIEQAAPSAPRAVELLDECNRLVAIVNTLPETIPPAPETIPPLPATG